MKKNYKLIITLSVVMCLLFSSLTVLAEPTGESAEDTVVQTEPVTEPSTEPESEEPVTEPDTTEEDNFIPSDYDTTDPETTEKRTPVVATTTRRPAPSTTRKPTTTRRPADDDDDREEQNNQNNQNDDNRVEITEEETLPEGSFYVYLERNNGTKRLKAILTKPELVTEPETPVREGFVFDGWYADPEFTKRWDFYKDLAQEGTVIYAKWVADPSAVVYKVSVEAVEGGTIEANPAVASVGEPVMIVVNPNEGMRLVAGSVTINGKSTDILSFSMPAEDVVISARFEAIPESKEAPEEEKNILPFIIGGVVLLVAIGVVVFFIIRRRDDYSDDEIDENGTIIDNDTDMSWVDESIIVGDGFKDGEKVIGNFIPEDDFSFEPEDEE